jgi:F-type H+-transporting ATPase subunit epsilon
MLDIEIISPAGIVFEGNGSMVVIPSVSGEIGVMKDHESFVAKLQKGKIIVYSDKQEIISETLVDSGFAEIKDSNKLIILID